MSEVWKAVPEYNAVRENGGHRYEVSNEGNIRVTGYVDYLGRVKKPRMVRQYVDSMGYHFVRLDLMSGTLCPLNVHGLVALAFVPNPCDFKLIRHIDGNPDNNVPSNLEWCVEDGIEIDRTHWSTDIMANGKYAKNGIRQYSYDGKLLDTFRSSIAIREQLGLHSREIEDYCRRQLKGHLNQGYVWRFVDDDELFLLSELERCKLIGMRPIRQYMYGAGLIAEFPSIRAAVDAGIASNGGIRRACKRLQVSCNGYIWRFADDDEFTNGVSLSEYVRGLDKRLRRTIVG